MSEIPEMVEKVARALCVASLRDPDKLVPALPNRTIMAWQQFEHGARAAIGEMREPLPSMSEAMLTAFAKDPEGWVRWGDVWRAGIDAALATPGEG
ncbi:hypothetical protein [Mesorhizobium sp. B263B2A]|uniref:hypothetical protein n=1 Tax=Mesorhizobium sp. B263B2A TaxID=2876669 RepID=UPI001CD08DCA|nr:hypothetical protein [Mesorhizobium sp. B263B2A]MCA0032784.1 hypothetical protein [Mesorhizobium sp. B263B2A]